MVPHKIRLVDPHSVTHPFHCHCINCQPCIYALSISDAATTRNTFVCLQASRGLIRPTLTVAMIREGFDDKFLKLIANTPDYGKFSSGVRTFAKTVSLLKTPMLIVQSVREGHDLLAKANLDALRRVCVNSMTRPLFGTKDNEK